MYTSDAKSRESVAYNGEPVNFNRNNLPGNRPQDCVIIFLCSTLNARVLLISDWEMEEIAFIREVNK